MKFWTFSTLLLLTSCLLSSDKSKAKKDIEQFYSESSLRTGAGRTDITSFEIISIEGQYIKAFLTGHYSNTSLPVSESREISDTLYFEYFDKEKPHKLKPYSPKN